MEIQLQELIEKIKSDGVAAAEKEAAARLETAHAEAEQIIADAKAEAEKIKKQVQEENNRFVKASEDAIRQAARNLLISFRETVTKELSSIINEKIAENYSKDILASLIPTVVEAWAKKTDADDISVLLNEDDLGAIEDSLMAALKERMLDGVILKADEHVNSGFRIAVQNGAAYYDYSAEAVADMFAAYLNPRVAALLKEAGNS